MRTMYDSTTAVDIPLGVGMVAGYLCGAYAWSPDDWVRFPDAVQVGICVNPAHDHGDVGDVETGDMTPASFPVWRQRRLARGVSGIGYCNRGNDDAIRQAVRAAIQPFAWLWLSTLDGSTPWASDVVAIQVAGQRLTGRHYDVSAVTDAWPGLPPASARVPDVILVHELGGDAIYVVGESGKRHLLPAEYAAWTARDYHPVDVAAADLAAIPDTPSGALSATAKVTGMLTVGP